MDVFVVNNCGIYIERSTWPDKAIAIAKTTRTIASPFPPILTINYFKVTNVIFPILLHLLLMVLDLDQIRYRTYMVSVKLYEVYYKLSIKDDLEAWNFTPFHNNKVS